MPTVMEGVPCGAVYEAALTCQPCDTTVTGACCLRSGECEMLPQYRCEEMSRGYYQGDGVACSEVDCPQPVSADTCAEAEILPVPSLNTLYFRNAVIEELYPNCVDDVSGGARDVWFKVVGTGRKITANTCLYSNGLFDTAVNVYCGDCDAVVCAANGEQDCVFGHTPFLSTVRDSFECNVLLEGDFYPDESCDDFECPAGGGNACCTPEGDCVSVNSFIDCAVLYNGDYYPGDNCLENGGDFVCPGDECTNPGHSGRYCTADIAGADCLVNIADLAALLAQYGDDCN